MICDFCYKEHSNTVYLDKEVSDKKICPTCSAISDRVQIKDGLNPGLILSEDKTYITNKFGFLRIPVINIPGKPNSYKFYLDDEPLYEYLFAVRDNKVTRFRFVHKKDKL